MSAFFDAYKAKKAKEAEEAKVQQDRASNLFSEQGKIIDPATLNPDGLSRIEQLKNISGGESLAVGYTKTAEKKPEQQQAGSKSIADSLRELKEKEKAPPQTAANVDPHSAANAEAAAAYVSSRANEDVYAGKKIEVEKASAKERSDQEKLEMAKLEAIQSGRHNVGFLTEVNSNSKEGSGLTNDEIMAGLSGFRNEGFLTETTANSQGPKATTQEEIETLENLNRIVGSRMNTTIGSAAVGGGANEEGEQK